MTSDAKLDEKQGERVQQRAATAIIQLDNSGLMKPADSSEDARYAKMMLDTHVLPASFQTVPQVILAVQMLRGLNLQPALCMRQVMVINGTLSVWGELPKAACERHLEWWEEFRFDKDYVPISFANKNLHKEAIGSITRYKRRDVTNPYEAYFTRAMAQRAGLMNKKGPWQQYTEDMLKFRARSRGLRDGCADVLSGTPIAEYDFNIMNGRGTPTFGDVNANTVAEEINKLGEIIEAPNRPVVRDDMGYEYPVQAESDSEAGE
jgi:hypothetical protein